MLGRLFVLAALCWVTVSAAAAPPQPRDESLNQYIDMVLDNLQVLLLENGLDPAPLPNASTGFSDVILGVEWHGEAWLYDGWLRGLATIYRSDDANFITNPETGGVIGFSTGIGIGAMQGHYVMLAKFMDLGPVCDVTMDIDGASATFDAALNQTSCTFYVSGMNVDRIGHISVDITGLGLLNWIFEIVVSLVVNVLELFIRNMIENTMESFINTALDSVDLGILGPILGCSKDVPLQVVYVPRQ
ncbi:hypothetical protein SK128_025462 [Halocaridina rubra]|uniref:Secreted protein n=1 Tax=Halocaridina rubra TaxID=373956 RepID=A0AAN9AAP5_HALRR